MSLDIPSIQQLVINRFPDVIFAVIYGSHVYNTATEESDVDVYVVLPTFEPNMTENTSIYVDRLDIRAIEKDRFALALQANEAKALEMIFIPEQFVLVGDSFIYRNSLVLFDPYLRHTFGEAARAAWNRGIKKLTYETNPAEHRLGKKSLYHAVRIFKYASQLHTMKRIDFAMLDEERSFYLNIRDHNVTDLLINGHLDDTYKRYNKQFRQIPNEEQYKQIQQKQQRTKINRPN